MIFVDTSAWFAALVSTDQRHRDATRFLTGVTQALLTTDYVVDETLTLLRSRGYRGHALRAGEDFFRRGIATVHFVTADEVQKAWDVFRRFADKHWSFTDCTSKVVIERLGITQVFVFDEHFRQFGSVEVVP